MKYSSKAGYKRIYMINYYSCIYVNKQGKFIENYTYLQTSLIWLFMVKKGVIIERKIVFQYRLQYTFMNIKF